MNRSVIRQQLFLMGLVLALWALLVLAFAGQLIFATNLAWEDAFRISLRDWFPWALLAPVTVWLATRFRFERGQWHLSVPVHLVACMLAVILCEWLTRPLMQESNPQVEPRGFAPNPPQARQPYQSQPGPRPPGGFQPNAPMQQFPRPFIPGAGVMLRAKFNLPIYWVIVFLVQAVAYQRRSEERERQALELEARLADAKLAALRMQLHPHFLFNTLNAIATLVHRDAHAADEMIANLSELLRGALDTTAQEIPLRQELDFLARYLDIQQVRFGDRLRVEKEIDAAALNGLVPTLILQPLVENAIRHGIEPHPQPGVIALHAKLDGGTLRLTVRDTGGGPTSHNQSPGIGLANTQSRLQALYGNRARLAFNTDAEGRFAVQLEIPFHEKSETPPRR